MANLDFVKKSLPWIGAAAAAFATGGPAGLLTVVVKGIGQILGKNVAPTADAIAAAVAGATPDQLLQMKKLDDDYAVQMQALGYQHAEEIEAIAAKDRESARSREVQVKDWTPRILACVVVCLCFGGEFWYFMHGSPAAASPELIGRILGTLDSALILVLSYYFGSSAGSASKDATIAGFSQNGKP